jgi:hypothetical protein
MEDDVTTERRNDDRRERLNPSLEIQLGAVLDADLREEARRSGNDRRDAP